MIEATDTHNDTIVYLGAGGVLQSPPKNFARAVYVEAQQELCDDLRTQIKQSKISIKTEVIQYFVGNFCGDILFKTFNFKALSSSKSPSNLLELFPGLEIQKETQIPQIDVQSLLKSLELEPKGNHALIIDTPGSEYDILSTLLDGEFHSLFESIQISTSEKPLYEDSMSLTDIFLALADADYCLQLSAPNRLGYLSVTGKINADTTTANSKPIPKMRELNRDLNLKISELEEELKKLKDDHSLSIRKLEYELATTKTTHSETKKLLDTSVKNYTTQSDKLALLKNESQYRNGKIQVEIASLNIQLGLIEEFGDHA